MKFMSLLLAMGLMTAVTACGTATGPEVEEDMPATEETEMMEEGGTEMMEEEEPAEGSE